MRDYDIEMYYGIEVGKPQNGDELERLVNVDISKKNGNKVRDRKFILGENFSEAEMQEAARRLKAEKRKTSDATRKEASEEPVMQNTLTEDYEKSIA